MIEPSSSLTDTNGEDGHDELLSIPRRKILSGAAAGGALLFSVGSASANGQGGEAVVHESDFKPNKSFVITAVSDCTKNNPDGSCWDDPLPFQCNGKGKAIPFPYWHFNYLDDFDENGNLTHERRRLYTRDNKVRTNVTYKWPGRGKSCGQHIQVGFAADNATSND